MGFIINEASIQQKVGAFGRTPAGKALIDRIIRTRVVLGTNLCRIEGDVLDEGAMYSAAGILKDLIISKASGLPSSIQDVVGTLSIGDVKEEGDGYYSIELNFGGNLVRQSLQPSRYSPVNNIIALFNNGYSARKQVWGEWPGHGRVGSRVSRPGLHFINDAVSSFNSQYGREYRATAIADSQYA